MSLYADAEGEIHTENAVCYPLETGDWPAWLSDETADTIVVETATNDTLWLVSITDEELPLDADCPSSAYDPSIEDAHDG